MPQLYLPTIDTQQSVVRPIVYGVIKDLFELTGIPADTMISFPGDLEVMQQPGSEIGSIGQHSGINTSAYTNRAFIEVEEDYEMDRVLSTAVVRQEYPYLFRDDGPEVGIRPIYSSTETTINFKFRNTDKAAAMRWRDQIRTRVAMNWDQRIHKVDYHYLLPIEYLIILKEIHRLIENVDGYGIEFNEYLLSKLSKRATVMTTQAATQAAWAMAESQVRIVGSFDFDLVPVKGSREDDGDAWTIEFAYKFKYDKPIACTMQYPLVIHNQLLPQNYRNNPKVDKIDKLEDEQFGFSKSSWLFYQFEKNVENRRSWELNGWKGYSIPSYDEFIPAITMPDTVRVFDALVTIDTLDPTKLLSLKELGKFKLDPAVLTYLVGEVQYLTKPGMSPFILTAYRGSDLLDLNTLSVDTDLNIYSTYLLSLRKYYHIRLSLITDFTKLTSAAIDRLRANGFAARKILQYVDPSLVTNNKLPAILANDYIAKAEMSKAIKAMSGVSAKDPLQMTVQTLIIIASNVSKMT